MKYANVISIMAESCRYHMEGRINGLISLYALLLGYPLHETDFALPKSDWHFITSPTLVEMIVSSDRNLTILKDFLLGYSCLNCVNETNGTMH